MNRALLLICVLSIVKPLRAQSVPSIQKVDSMAALRALPIPTGSDSGQVELRGYDTVGDGGGGLFSWDATSAYVAPTGTTMNTAGTGYTAGSLLLVGTAPAYSTSLVYVSAVDSNGAITGYQLCPGSSYPALPSGAQATSARIGAGSGATFTLTGATLDDNGSYINPTSNTGAGRWRRETMVADPTNVNVRWFGAKCENIYTPTTDSLRAIEEAIWASPDDDYLPVQYPGAANSGHQKKVTVYLPGGPQNFGYSVSNTLYASAEMYWKGDGMGKSNLGFSVGRSFAQETWVIRYCYGSNTPGNANTTFDTGVSDLNIFAGGTNNAGLFFLGCNGSFIRNVAVNSTERSIYVDSGGVVIDNVRPTSTNTMGLELHGQQIEGTYWDVEHCNSTLSGRTASVFPTGTFGGFAALDGVVKPAILIQATVVHAGIITGETSPIIVLVNGADVTIESLSGNVYGSDTQLPDSCLARVWQSDNVAVRHFNNQSNATFPHGMVYDTRNDGSNRWNVQNFGYLGGRSSYSEGEDILRLGLYGNVYSVGDFGIYNHGVNVLNFSGPNVSASGAILAQSMYSNSTVDLGSSDGAYGLFLQGYDGGPEDVAGTDGRYRLQITSHANGNVTLYGTVTKTGWGIMKDNPVRALDVNGDAQVSGNVSCGTLNVRSLPTSPTGLSSGDIYRSGTTLMVVP